MIRTSRCVCCGARLYYDTPDYPRYDLCEECKDAIGKAREIYAEKTGCDTPQLLFAFTNSGVEVATNRTPPMSLAPVKGNTITKEIEVYDTIVVDIDIADVFGIA